MIAANVRAAESIGLPLHVLGRDGNVRKSFGAQPPIQRVDDPEAMWQGLAAAGSGVWSASLLRYRLELWSAEGRLVRRLDREASWFRPQTEYGVRQDPRREPAPGLPFIRVDAGGKVWTVIRVPDADWKRAFELGTDPYGRRAQGVGDLNKYYDSVVEVIDPDAGQVIARARFDHAIRGFAGDGLVFASERRDPGYPVVVVWKISAPRQQ